MFDKHIIIVAGMEEGFSFADAEVAMVAKENIGKALSILRERGFTQFILTKQVGYEYTLEDGKILSRDEEHAHIEYYPRIREGTVSISYDEYQPKIQEGEDSLRNWWVKNVKGDSHED